MNAISFRVQLLAAMMLIVLGVTGVTLYVAERSVQIRYQESLELRFQSEMRRFTEVQEAQLDAVTEKCRTLSTSVRLRAALEERDVDDLYQNALTELQTVVDPQAPEAGEGEIQRASFFRFLDPSGEVLSPSDDQSTSGALDEALTQMGRMLPDIKTQTVGYIALTEDNDSAALREVILTKILDWDGKDLGVLVLGFPVRNVTGAQAARETATRSGVWLINRLYLEGLESIGSTPSRAQA